METARTFNAPPKRVGFLLMGQFTLISLSSAIDPLRVPYLLSPYALYRCRLLTPPSLAGVPHHGQPCLHYPLYTT